MYFTDDKKLQRFEREMKIVPNFERKEVWEYADSCNECKNYECKLESCMEAHCPYLKRKIRSNSIITRDLVETFLVDNPYIPFAHRVINMLAKYKGNKLFYNKAHKAAFEASMNEINDDDYDHIACVYVLTIRPDIWEHCVHSSQGYLCMSAEIEQKDRVLVSFANDIYRSTTKLSLKEISFRRNISDKEFYYVCNANSKIRIGGHQKRSVTALYRVSRDKPHRKRSEEMKEKYPVLIGHSARACKKLFTMEQVADFICEQGLYGEVTIETPEGLMLISTYGIYLDKVTDMEYRAQLLEILEPKQHALEKAEFGFAFGEIL